MADITVGRFDKDASTETLIRGQEVEVQIANTVLVFSDGHLVKILERGNGISNQPQ